MGTLNSHGGGKSEAAAFEKKQEEQELPRIVNSMAASLAAAASGLPVAGKNLLWVDDQPENNAYGIKALESNGINRD